jgi:peroxiredoxin
MKNFVFNLVFLISSGLLFAQSVSIRVENLNQDKAVLFSLTGEKVFAVDSLTAIGNKLFQFSLENNHSGIYRIAFNNNKWLDFIYDNKDIELETDLNNISGSLKVIKSANKIYYDFVYLNNDYKTKTELLLLILSRYPENDDYFQISKEKLIRVQKDYLNFVNVTSQADPNSFIARYVRTAQLPVVDPALRLDEQLTYLKTHALDNVNFGDDELIYSDVFTNKTIETLSYYRNPQFPLDLLEKEFMVAVDSILNKAAVNEIVYRHIVEYLMEGFRKFGFDNVLDFIIENYVLKENLCLNEKLESSFERRIEQAKKFRKGDAVPDIVVSDSSGKQFNLNDLKSERTLILFYSSRCPHCQNLIPQLSELYNNQKEKNTEVLAISIDTSGTGLINDNWINITDLKGWNGKAAGDYFIYAIPAMFLIDKEKKLIMMPKTVEEVKNLFD